MAKQKKKVVKKLNPFVKGVTYDDLLKACEGTTVKEYLKGVVSDSAIEFIEDELKQYKSNKK